VETTLFVNNPICYPDTRNVEVERRTIRHGEYGFLQATPSGVPAGFSMVVLPTLPVPHLMFDVMIVEPAHGAQEHLVISAHSPRLDEALYEHVRQAVSSRWPAALTSFITESVYEPEGPTCRSVVYSGLAGHRVEVAAAVAESLRAGTLDDIHT